MNKRGFTLVELLAVIVIIGILSTVASVEVFRYRKVANEKEAINLKSTIEDCYNEYRKDSIINGRNYSKNLTFNKVNKGIYQKYFNSLSYDGNKIDINNAELKIDLHEKGELYRNNECYNKNGRNDELILFERTCLITTNSYNKNVCEKAPSKEELICVKLTINGKLVIDDYDLDKSNNLCVYFNSSVSSKCSVVNDRFKKKYEEYKTKEETSNDGSSIDNSDSNDGADDE